MTAKNVRKEVQKQESWEESITIGTLPLSKRAKLLIESATNYAIENKHSSVGTGGFLLAMIMTHEPTATLLRTLGVDLEVFSKDLIGQISSLYDS